METTDQIPLLHLHYEGRSHDVPLTELDVGDLSSDQDVRTAAAQHFEVPVTKLANFDVRRNNETNDITLAPQATFG